MQISESWSNAIASRNIAQVVNILMGVCLVLLCFKLLLHKPTTVVVPPKFTQEFTIQGDQVSEEYKASWAIYLANTIGNTNQRNIEFNKGVVVSMLSPNLQDALADKLNRAAEILKTRKVKQTFVVEDTRYDSRNDIVYVWGKKIITTMRQSPIVTNWTFEIQVSASQGMPRITYLKQYTGTPKVNELKGKVVKETPDYLSPEIEDVVSGVVIKNTTNVEGLGNKPDISPKQTEAK